jgi:hypothetical protein
MKKIDRLNLISAIGRVLQSRMTFSDIDIYLEGFGINCQDRVPSYNSKWVYVKEILADVDIQTILEIANELEIAHSYPVEDMDESIEAEFWHPNHFRLFVSHLSTYRKQVAALQRYLLGFGISAFVAHKDIEPTKEWQNELENALNSMDALAALLSPDFRDSYWTDQEIGAAVGRGVLVIPLKQGTDPYGFIQKYQALDISGKKPSIVADEVFSILMSNSLTKTKLANSLANLIATASDAATARKYLKPLSRYPKLDVTVCIRLKEGIENNEKLIQSHHLISQMNSLLRQNECEMIEGLTHNEDIPF